jgi:hypothetical protein
MTWAWPFVTRRRFERYDEAIVDRMRPWGIVVMRGESRR